MPDDVVIRVENLSKLYKIGARQQGYKTLRESIMGILTAPFRRLAQRAKRKAPNDAPPAPSLFDSRPNTMLSAPCPMPSSSDDHIWALKDISFEVKRGEVVGIIGRNGAGKTTLLKILSRITEPTEGRAEIHGRVGSLLEVGTGFHQELTGRENIYLNGAILGMRKAEIAQKFEDIVDFAEIEKFIDTPVKRYSSGMYVRLAFAVAAHLEPEILLVDEVLAVGDAAFQKKCLGKMGAVAKEGRTVFFVSHNMSAITRLCGKAFLMEEGKLINVGGARKIVQEYLSAQTVVTGYWERPQDPAFPGSSEVQIMRARVLSHNGQPVSGVELDKPFCVEVEYKLTRTLRGCAVVLQLLDSEGKVILTTWDTDRNELLREQRLPGVYSSICKFPAHLIRPGVYSFTLAAHIPRIKTLDFWEGVLSFDVLSVGSSMNENRAGTIVPLLDWEIRHQ